MFLKCVHDLRKRNQNALVSSQGHSSGSCNVTVLVTKHCRRCCTTETAQSEQAGFLRLEMVFGDFRVVRTRFLQANERAMTRIGGWKFAKTGCFRSHNLNKANNGNKKVILLSAKGARVGHLHPTLIDTDSQRH